MSRLLSTLLFSLLLSTAAPAAITISSIADKTKYDAPQAFTVSADPNAATTTATLDGFAINIGTSNTVTAIGYHELRAESRTAANVLVDSKFIRFITRDPNRGGTEDGIPPHTPYRSVNDAPSAFAGQTLKVIAPAAWPTGLPIPIAAVLRSTSDGGVRLNGLVSFGGFPQTTLQMRRGWGSVVAPARTAAGVLDVAARVNGLTANPSITIEAASPFTSVSGAIAANTSWPANSRMHITGTLTINAGVTLTIGAGTIVKIDTGNGTAGSAAEVVVNGTLQINGVEGNPVVFTPAIAGQLWGGIELPVATSTVNAAHAIFHGSGEDATWFNTHSGYSTHKPQQALFLVAGSGSGTGVGAQLHLSDCYCFSVGGQMMNSRTNTWIDLSRTLMQKAITCGELNGSKVTIDRCALIEFPSEDATFVDGDNDALYMTNGDETVSNTVIGFGKDDGIDTGGNGGDNPFTAVADVTPFTSQNNWYEGTFHEGNSLSGTRNVTFTGCVFLNVGQGVETGYSTSATGDGPNAVVDSCLFVSNMVGVRWGDNYGTGYSYNGSMEVKNSLLLNSFYHDAFSGQWHPTQANAWIYQDATATNSFGRPYFNLHNNYLSQPDSLHHPANTSWNPAVATQAQLLAQFMPVPGSNVGVAISSYAPAQNDVLAYPGVFTARLSTFSSKPVSVNWFVVGKNDPMGGDVPLLSGALTFAPGETLKTINAAFPGPNNYALLHVGFSQALNAEVTGEAWYFRTPTAQSPTLVAYGSSWKYLDNGSNQGTGWRQSGFSETGWKTGIGQFGYGDGDETTPVEDNATAGYVAADIDRYATTYFRKTFSVADASQIASLSVTLLYDDGGVVYLNGTRVAATAGMPVDPAYNYYLGGTAPPDNATITASIPTNLLINGTNTIAVEMHQQSAGSSDMSFDLQLAATYNVAPPLQLNLARSGAGAVLYWFDAAAQLEESTDLSTWTAISGSQSPVSLNLAGLKRFFRLRR